MTRYDSSRALTLLATGMPMSGQCQHAAMSSLPPPHTRNLLIPARAISISWCQRWSVLTMSTMLMTSTPPQTLSRGVLATAHAAASRTES
jgi:hypothetical protein